MRDRRIVIVVGLVLLGLLSGACRETSDPDAPSSAPATLEPVRGTDRVRVILTREAAERIDLQTAPVVAGREGELVIPYAAVFYGLDGDTWTYVSVEPLTFEREPISVERVDHDLAYLSDGPAAGTPVVTVGAAELFGAETGVSE